MLKQDSGQRRDSTDQQRLICAGVHSPAGLPSSWWYHRAVVEGVSIKIQLRHPNCRKCYACTGPVQGGGRGGRGRGEGATREGGETGNRGIKRVGTYRPNMASWPKQAGKWAPNETELNGVQSFDSMVTEQPGGCYFKWGGGVRRGYG